jgi:hypothetical protein
MIERAGLRHGRVLNLRSGRVAVTFLSNPALDNEPVRAELAIAEYGTERHVTERHETVREGDTFTVGGERWAVEGIDNVGTYEYVVRIAKVTPE